ncbi:hypothetical protein [Haloarchaeobius sp. TZWSO28]|uniref:hypothetical protein n=1 Tax=Haloarchaeobius sp. TZWSO28 TaxID=3446119 RepID=UPI003EB99A66
MPRPSRRAFLSGVTAGVSFLAGCGGTIQNRPDRFSVTPTRTTRPANPEAPSLDPGDLQRRVEPPDGGSFVRAYDQRGLQFLVDPTSPVMQTVPDDELRLRIRAQGYPAPEPGEVYDEKRVTVEPAADGRTGVTVPLDPRAAPEHRTVYYTVALLPGGTEESAPVHLHETDPFLVSADSITAVRSRASEELADVENDSSVRRTSVEGAIRVAYPVGDGRVALSVPKSAYLRAGHYAFQTLAPQSLVSASVRNGVVPRLARSIVGQTMVDGVASTPRELVNHAIDVVQALPNGPKSVTETYDSNRKSLAQTVIELGGDSEDRSLLLAGLLATAPFDLDVVVLVVDGHAAEGDGHAAVGLRDDSATGDTYTLDGRTYAFVETTELGWDVGEAPTAYQGAPVEWYRPI